MNVRWLIRSSVVLGIVCGFAPGASADVPGQERGDPRMNVAGAQRGVHYGPLEPGKPLTAKLLFGNRYQPRGRDVRQGHAGDCYVDSTASAYAQFHPKVIKSQFMDSGRLRTSPRGTPEVRFFEHDRDSGTFKPVTATYTGRVPVNDKGKPVLNKDVDHHIWSPTLEYAYTKFRDEEGGSKRSDNPNKDRTGYNRTANGGYPNHVMEAMTGKKAYALEVKPHKGDELWAALKEAQEKDQVVVVGSTTANNLRHRVATEIHDGHLDERARPSKFDNRSRWVSTHAYAAWGNKDKPFVFEKNGERYIRLRNPWGETPPGGKGKDGVGEIPFKSFLLRYDRIYIGEGSAQDE